VRSEGRASSGPRIAIVLQGDSTNPSTWSGVPAGISSGLAAAGAEPIPIDARFPAASKLARAIGMSWVGEATNPLFATAGSMRAATSIRAAGRIDGAVAIGSGYSLSAKLPTVTFEDMTVAQALAQPGPTYAGLSEAASRRWRRRQGRNYRSSRGCCVASHWALQSIRDDYGVDGSKIHVVGFGRNAEPRTIERDWSKPHFLFIGIDWERKRGPAVVAALSEVRRRFPQATLDLVGGHPEIEAPGVIGHGVLSLGTVDGRKRHAALLEQATCMVLPSSYEPFGIAYLDAGAAGVPSIGTTAGGAADAVGPGGVLVDPDDQDALIRAMLELADPATARGLGEKASAHSALFTWQAVAERLLRALRLPGVDQSRLASFLEPYPSSERSLRSAR
jgi:hypothetical protein